MSDPASVVRWAASVPRRALRRFGVYASDAFRVYEWPRQAAPPDPPRAKNFFGLNALARASDAPRVALPSFYDPFVHAGDGAVVVTEEGRPLGWGWLRRGPYVDDVGCGRVRVPNDVEIIRFLEVDPSARGRGLGVDVLRELTRRALEEHHGRIVAFVGEYNVPSQRSFESVGYRWQRRIGARNLLGRALVSGGLD